MEPRLQEELDRLKQRLLSMAARVEANIALAIEGLESRDPALLNDVIARDVEVDLAELRIDEMCISLLALYQPVARDLRLIATALKIVKDIERVGDISKNIAKHGLGMLRERPIPLPTELGRMARSTRELLRRSLDAFVGQDVVLARQVIREDDEVDQLHRENVQRFIRSMIRDTAAIGPTTQLMAVNKFLERIGDHSTNIAAMVVFLVEGRDIRHPKKQQMLREEQQDRR